MHGMLPPYIFALCSPEAQADELAAYRRSADAEAADLLDRVASHAGAEWSDPRTSTRLRRMIRLVAEHLRDRGDG